MSATQAGGTTASTIVSNRERLAGVVQAVGRRPADVPRRRWESTLVLLLTTTAYTWFGWWLVVEAHVVGFETLDRLNRALMIWHNDPAKLSAIGFDHPPLATLLLSPLTVVSGLARSLVVVPLASAFFAGLVLMTLNTMLRRAQVAAPLRVAVLVALGCNPLLALYAAGGARHVIWLAFVVVAMGALFAWYVTADIRFVMLSGLAWSVAALAGYASLVWFVLSLLMVAGVLARLGADGTEVEGTTVGFASPTVYVIALWTAFNGLLLLDPFGWLTSSGGSAEGLQGLTPLDLVTGTGSLVLHGAPLALVVLPALVFTGIARRNAFALWLGIMLAAAVVVPALAVVLRLTDEPLLMRNALPILLFAVIGAIWLARSAGEASTVVSALLVVALLASIPWTFRSMRTYEHQNLESAFVAAVSTRESQEGTRTRDGSTVGIVSEEAMAAWIRDNVTRRSSILTDNASTYAVMLMTGRPDLFLDRVDRSDGPWLEAARDPARHVDYLLLSTSQSGDLLSELYPDAADGSSALLTAAYTTPRYTLVVVPTGFRRGEVSLQVTDDQTDTSEEAAS